jgi:hypothetical protein
LCRLEAWGSRRMSRGLAGSGGTSQTEGAPIQFFSELIGLFTAACASWL